MQTRKPIVAGQFYPSQHDSCVDEINSFLNEPILNEALPETISAGIVPHAGWSFSGAIAAMVFRAVKEQHDKVNTFVIFGAAHSYFGGEPAVYNRGFWETPLGEVAVDEDLADALLKTGTVVGDCGAHRTEHSIEVQIPFIQHIFAGAKILPVLVPPTKRAIALGESIGEIIKEEKPRKIVCIGSADLTHYGPRYGFTPMGIGQKALQWANDVNDRQFIDLAVKLDAQALLTGAANSCYTCGPGSAAATVAVAKKLGSERGILLAHTNSNQVMLRQMGTTSSESVGYAAIIF